ncbi:MAG: hypothetical protein ABH969_01960 [Pseudomonadota bacterium]
MKIKKIEVGGFENNCYILTCPRAHESIIIDPAAEADRILLYLSTRRMTGNQV